MTAQPYAPRGPSGAEVSGSGWAVVRLCPLGRTRRPRKILLTGPGAGLAAVLARLTAGLTEVGRGVRSVRKRQNGVGGGRTRNNTISFRENRPLVMTWEELPVCGRDVTRLRRFRTLPAETRAPGAGRVREKNVCTWRSRVATRSDGQGKKEPVTADSFLRLGPSVHPR